MTQTVNVSAGATEYTWPVTLAETGGADISDAAVQISLGTYELPGTWETGLVTRPTDSSVTIKLLIDDTYPGGTYYVWTKVTDQPEIVVRRAHRVVITGSTATPTTPDSTDGMPATVTRTLVRGDTRQWVDALERVDSSGNVSPMDLSGWTWLSQLRAPIDQGAALLATITVANVTDGKDGQLRSTLAAVDAAALPLGSVYYSLRGTDPNGHVRTFLTGKWKVISA